MGLFNQVGKLLKKNKVKFETIKNEFPEKEIITAGIDVSIYLFQSMKNSEAETLTMF